MKRAPKQSQLDYLWVNYGANPEFTRIERKGNKLIGYNDKGIDLFEVEYSGPLSSSGIQSFGVKGDNYYIKLSDGYELTAPIQVPDNIKLLVEQHEEALQVINGDGEGSLKQVLELAKEYTDSKVVDLDVSKLQLQINELSQDLSILKGSEDIEGSVLSIVNNTINSAFEWKNLIN